MIAKYNGFCKVTNQPIVAGETELEKVNGVWQIKPANRPIKEGAAHPPSRQRHSFLHRGLEVHIYLYVGAYNNWKVWKIVELHTGAEIDLTEKHLGFVNTGSNFRNPVGHSQNQAEQAVRAKLDWWMDFEGERTTWEAEQKAKMEAGEFYYVW